MNRYHLGIFPVIRYKLLELNDLLLNIIDSEIEINSLNDFIDGIGQPSAWSRRFAVSMLLTISGVNSIE